MRAILVQEHPCFRHECHNGERCSFAANADLIIISTMVCVSLCSLCHGVQTEDFVTVCVPNNPKAANLMQDLAGYWASAELFPGKRFVFQPMTSWKMVDFLKEKIPGLKIVQG